MTVSRTQQAVFIVLLITVTLLFVFLLTPFFHPLFWAAVIAGIFTPFYRRLNVRRNRPNLNASLTMGVISILIIVPAAVIASLLIAESLALYETINTNSSTALANVHEIMDQVSHSTVFKGLAIDETIIIEKVSDAIKVLANYIVVNLSKLTQNTLLFFVQFGIMLYALFFLIRDGEKFLGMALRLCPLGRGREKTLYSHFIVTAKATLKVTLLIGGVQGFLGGVIFWITGIDGALVWGVLMVATSIVPGVGSAIVWFPAALIMLVTAHWWEAMLILGFCGGVISTVDNFLRPVLLGMDVEMHPLLIFLSTLGGIVIFGFSGFVIGPIITALLLAIWKMYEQDGGTSRQPAGEVVSGTDFEP